MCYDTEQSLRVRDLDRVDLICLAQTGNKYRADVHVVMNLHFP